MYRARIFEILIFSCPFFFWFIAITQKILVLQHWDSSYLKAVNLGVLMSDSTNIYGFFMSRDIEDQKCKKNLSYKPRKLFAQYSTLLWPQTFYKFILLEQLLVLLVLAPFGTFSKILKLNTKKVFFGIFYSSLKKHKNGLLKIKFSKIRARHISSMLL